jgi:hypothetical protein
MGARTEQHVSDFGGNVESRRDLLEDAPEWAGLLDEHYIIRVVIEKTAALSSSANEALVDQSFQKLVPRRRSVAKLSVRDQRYEGPRFQLGRSNRGMGDSPRNDTEPSFDSALLSSILLGGLWVAESTRDIHEHKDWQSARRGAEERIKIWLGGTASRILRRDVHNPFNAPPRPMVGFAQEDKVKRDSRSFAYLDLFRTAKPRVLDLLLGQAKVVSHLKRCPLGDVKELFVEFSRFCAPGVDVRSMYLMIPNCHRAQERLLTSELSRLAFHDPLLDLARKAGFGDRYVEIHARVARQGLDAQLAMNVAIDGNVIDAYS